jgi:hypothetical protein
MQSRYPPASYIDQRFAATSSIRLLQDTVTSLSKNTATVAVNLIEESGGQRRQWIGSWRLVRSYSGWLLDQPDFWCCW